MGLKLVGISARRLDRLAVLCWEEWFQDLKQAEK
jgi:hypothetical protein